ncbi:unnamed protein product [Caenorhabditis nigoni]
MKRKVTDDTRTVFSASNIKTEVAEDETPVWKKPRTNRQDSLYETISTEVPFVTPLGAPLKYLNRNRFTSLWIALPRADQSQLLKFVLGDKPIEGLPGSFKVFLADWLMSVQQKMIGTLNCDGLRKTMKSVNVKCHESIKRSDERICTFLQKTLRTILETQKLFIFERELSWIIFIRRFAKNWKLKEEIDETVLTSVFAELSKKAKKEMSSFFTGSQEHKSKEAKVYYCHILRFVVKFTFNTLRHVFKFDSENSTFFYDGELEEDATVYQRSQWGNVAEENEVKPRHLLPKEVVSRVPPPNVPSSLTGDDGAGTSRRLNSQFVSDESVPRKWIDAFKSQEARWEARYQELKAEIRELKEEKRRRLN